MAQVLVLTTKKAVVLMGAIQILMKYRGIVLCPKKKSWIYYNYPTDKLRTEEYVLLH